MTTTAPNTMTTGRWDIDPSHSSVGFTARHLGLTKVRGQFNSFSGSVTITEDRLASSVEAVIELGSVDTNNPDRDGHLRSTDFFGSEESPTMEFRSTAVTESTLAGEISLNGITKPVVFDLEFHGLAVDGYEVERAGFSASGQILRSDYGIDFNMPLGVDGMLISDKINIELEIQIVPSS